MGGWPNIVYPILKRIGSSLARLITTGYNLSQLVMNKILLPIANKARNVATVTYNFAKQCVEWFGNRIFFPVVKTCGNFVWAVGSFAANYVLLPAVWLTLFTVRGLPSDSFL